MQAFKSYFTPIAQDGEKTQTQSPVPVPKNKTAKKPGQSRKQHALFKSSSSSTPTISIELSQTMDKNATTADGDPVYHDSSRSGFLKPSTHHASSVSAKPSEVTTGTSTPDTTKQAVSRPASFRHSAIFPSLDATNSRISLIDIKNDMMVKWLYEQQLRKQYASGSNAFEGVVLKKARGDFTCCPPQMSLIPNSLYAMVAQMNVRCAMTVNTPVVRSILGALRREDPDMDFVPLAQGLRVQIIRTMTDLPRSQLHHFAAFVEDMGMLIVWEDDAETLLQRVQFLEAQLVEMIWGNGPDDLEETLDEKAPAHVDAAEIDPAQLEDALAQEHRPVQLTSAAMVGLTMALMITCLGLGWRAIVLQIMVDGSMLRLALLAVTPIQFFVSLVRNSLAHGLPYTY